MWVHVCALGYGVLGETLGELRGVGWGCQRESEQVSTEPAWLGRVELGGAGGSRSRFQRGIGVWVSVRECVSQGVCGYQRVPASPPLRWRQLRRWRRRAWPWLPQLPSS